MVADNTVLPPETVVPPFAVYSGSPGTHTADLPEATQDLMTDYTKSYYHHFIRVKDMPSTPREGATTAKLVDV